MNIVHTDYVVIAAASATTAKRNLVYDLVEQWRTTHILTTQLQDHALRASDSH